MHTCGHEPGAIVLDCEVHTICNAAISENSSVIHAVHVYMACRLPIMMTLVMADFMHAQVIAGRGGAGSSGLSQQEDEGDALESSSSTVAAAGAAKRRLVAAMMKKFLTDEMLPSLLELRSMLAAKRSPLAGELNLTLMALLKEHKSEVLGSTGQLNLLLHA